MVKTALRILVFFSVFSLAPDVLAAADVLVTGKHSTSRARMSAALPFLTLRKHPSLLKMKDQTALRRQKLRLTPGNVVGRALRGRTIAKESPQITRTFNRRKSSARETRKKTHTGAIFDIEAAYGLYDTFIGRIQHGTQLKGAHYSSQGHWERTKGEHKDRSEENIGGHLILDIDLSKNAIASLHGSYFESSVELPPLHEASRHKKSDIALIAGLRVNFDPETTTEIVVLGEDSVFSDHQGFRFQGHHYGGQITLKQLWGARNSFSVQSEGYWDRIEQEEHHLETRYYGRSALLNSFALHDALVVEAGVQFDYYHSEDLAYTDYLIAPMLTTRFRLFRNTTFYTTYHPHLHFPEFHDLYIQKLYTSVNPELHAEKILHSVESGITQRFGDAVSLNLGFFYQEYEDLILQIDENSDDILEYLQADSVRLMGFKTSLQMNFLEQLVQNITYTYTDYEVLAWQADSAPGLEEALTYQPNHQVQASLYWLSPWGLAIDFNGVYISEQFRNRSSSQSRIGKRFFLNLTLTQKITENFQCYLMGRNLTDTDPYDIIPLLDSEEITSSRMFIGGVRLRF